MAESQKDDAVKKQAERGAQHGAPKLAEFGVIEKKGTENVGQLVCMLDEDDEELAQIPEAPPWS